jgi:hypothetical protein
MEHLAYIDPGSGSLVVQALIAAIVAIPVIFHATIRRVIDGIRNKRGRTDR